MATGTLTLICSLLVIGQVPGDVGHFDKRNLKIPYDFPPGRRTEVREMVLYASSDQGRNWQKVAVNPPEKDAFVFSAPADGLYWFHVVPVNRQGKQEPENIFQNPPGLKVIIDTLKPLARITAAQRQGDEVAVSWEVKEDNLDLSSLKLEYQPKDSPSAFWMSVPLNPTAIGDRRFRVNDTGPLALRLYAKDQAGNVTLAPAEVAGTSGITPANFAPGAIVPGVAPPLPKVDGDVKIAPPPALDQTPKPNWPGESTKPLPPSSLPTVPEPNARLVASSDQTPAPSPGLTPPSVLPGESLIKKPLPPIQYVNTKTPEVEYELSRVGPSGLGSVDLYLTHDNGDKWEHYAEDPKVQDKTAASKYRLQLPLPSDGQYGFRLAIKNRAGVGKAPPKAGEAPEMIIEVDTKAPMVQLFAPVPDEHTRNAVVLSWKAADKNLAGNPVILEWAANREGPWEAIAVNLENTNRHSWRLPERLPVQVYLRIRVRDLAGNEGIAVTGEPQIVDLTEPEGRLVSVVAGSARP
jgi:hypothetical protein